jgi:hypothetical protein
LVGGEEQMYLEDAILPLLNLPSSQLAGRGLVQRRQGSRRFEAVEMARRLKCKSFACKQNFLQEFHQSVGIVDRMSTTLMEIGIRAGFGEQLSLSPSFQNDIFRFTKRGPVL